MSIIGGGTGVLEIPSLMGEGASSACQSNMAGAEEPHRSKGKGKTEARLIVIVPKGFT